MLHEPIRAVGRQSTLLHAVQHGGVSCMGVMKNTFNWVPKSTQRTGLCASGPLSLVCKRARPHARRRASAAVER